VAMRVTPFGHTRCMVPVTLQQRPAPLRDGPVGPADGCRAASVAGARGAPGRDDVLTRLRDRSAQRPRFDPGLAGGLRAWLEDGAGALVATRGDDAPPLFLGPRRLLGHPDPAPTVRSKDQYPAQVVTSYLVHALFRQLVMTGSVGDPLHDAVDALSLQPDRAGVVSHVTSLDARSRSSLASELTRQIGHLQDLTPHFAPSWLPRTDDRVAIPLAGGRVVLCGTFDLLVGAPIPGQASVCALQLTSGGPWAFARIALHYLALLETLRNGSPPFRLALLDSAVGRYVIEDVREEHLRAMVSHLVTRLSGLAEAHA
jgi:hypothetical protein